MKKRVLVIENDPDVRAAICTMLERGGYEPSEAIDGLDGVDAFVHSRFDLVVTDLVMPQLGGLDAITHVRRIDPYVPIIAVSGFAWDQDSGLLKEAADLGANRALGKPFRPDEFLAVVRELLEDQPVGLDVRELGRGIGF